VTLGLKAVLHNEEKNPAISIAVVGHIMFEIKSKLRPTGKLKSSIYNIYQKLLQISFHYKKDCTGF